MTFHESLPLAILRKIVNVNLRNNAGLSKLLEEGNVILRSSISDGEIRPSNDRTTLYLQFFEAIGLLKKSLSSEIYTPTSPLIEIYRSSE